MIIIFHHIIDTLFYYQKRKGPVAAWVVLRLVQLLD